MIPVKLKVRNFMCYRDNVPALHFDGVHTACISGDNGNGKSALIDAMTWALWGKARARSDDDLVHAGDVEMEVEFDFAVGEQRYRIIRKHARPRRRGGSGRTILEFQIATGDGMRQITGNSLAQTQQKIIDVLRMDYTTFINSAFLRQGQADEFTKQAPTKRKEVLANILGLSFYDQLAEQAREVARERGLEGAQLESGIEDMSSELARKPAYQSELEQAQNELSQIEGVIGEQESRLNRLRQERESLEGKRQQLGQLEEHIANRERDRERWDEQIEQHRSRIKEYEEVMSRRSTIEEGYARFTAAKARCDELDSKFRQSVNLEKQKSQLEGRVKEAEQGLITEHALVQGRLGELEARSQKMTELRGELRKTQAGLQVLSGEEEALSDKRQGGQQLRVELNYLESGTAQLKREIGEIEGKLGLLLSPGEARCPLCETELGSDGLKLIETKYEAERDGKAEALKTNQAQLADKKQGLQALEDELSQLEAGLNQRKVSAQSRAGILSQQITEAEAAGNQLAGERTALSEVEQRLARRDFALVEQEALGRLEGELAELGYDAEQHEQVRRRLLELEQHEAPRRRLEEADRLWGQEGEAMSRAEAASEELRRGLELDNRKRQGLTAELVSLPQVAGDLSQAEAENQALVERRNQAKEKFGVARARLERCLELEERRKEKEKQLVQAAKEEKVFRDLAEAFGKRGVQALLIEMALPEIEIEADRLLSHMTDNRMHVKIETQRETKKGDIVETLDINISDELGTRNYELFSGGEAFRINFALRIALSKLLARRAGAPLPTLVIDEGFGTQDSGGIEKLKEAINSIQDDFDKILVITHIDELKDAFPTRIDVTKGGDGSTFRLG